MYYVEIVQLWRKDREGVLTFFFMIGRLEEFEGISKVINLWIKMSGLDLRLRLLDEQKGLIIRTFGLSNVFRSDQSPIL